MNWPEITLFIDKVAQFNVYLMLVNSILPLVFAFYAGAWGDRFGRKFQIFIFLIGRILSQLIITMCSYFLMSPKEYLLLAGLPIALVGKWSRISIELKKEPNYRRTTYLVLGYPCFHFWDFQSKDKIVPSRNPAFGSGCRQSYWIAFWIIFVKRRLVNSQWQCDNVKNQMFNY